MSLRRSGLFLISLTVLLSGCAIFPWGQEAGPQTALLDDLTAFVEENRGPGFDDLLPRDVTVAAVVTDEAILRIDFSPALLQQPVRSDTEWRLRDMIRPIVEAHRPGEVFTITADNQPLSIFVPRPFGGSGPERDRGMEIVRPETPQLVRTPHDYPIEFDQGLAGRHIALWHSHGWYYSADADRWEWQRPRMFTAVEDNLPMSFVLPLLMPMIENAGGVALNPRERDFQPHEVVVDNRDSSTLLDGDWVIAEDPGFLAGIDPLPKDVNPHSEGDHVVAQCSDANAPSATWTPRIPADGDYAVYVSYGSAPDRAADAHYTIRHAGGVAHREVNQQIGGHIWVYLGTFSFNEGSSTLTGSVTLDGSSSQAGGTVSADAVRFGGGMGNVEVNGRTSGYPRFLEAAHYAMQYGGSPSELTYQADNDWNEYTQDYAGRPEWVNWLAGFPNGPNADRSDPGLGIPIDLSFALHTDAGIKDGITGTLMIYTPHGQNGEEDTEFPDERPRMLNRELGDLIQTQVVDDIHAQFSPAWTRRQLWARSYAESRRPNVPSGLMELASHQNFDDQTALQDPRFRFTVARAIYKGMLRFIAAENGFDPIVEPLAPTHFSVEATGPGEFHLSWQPQSDPLEPTAEPLGYLVYHREGGPIGDRWIVPFGGGFDEPTYTAQPELTIRGLDRTAVHSFRVTAINRGGESFPSTTLAGAWGGANAPEVLIVDAFDRIGPPFIVNLEGEREGLDRTVDRGVGYGTTHSLTGDEHDFNPAHAWAGGGTPWNNDHPGHGASMGDLETATEVGNLFDFAAIHAVPLHALGLTVSSTTDEALEANGLPEEMPDIIDWLLGEERTTLAPPWAQANGHMEPEFAALPEADRQLISQCLEAEGHLILSGAHWASDVADPDSPGASSEGAEWITSMLGVQWITDRATDTGEVLVSPHSPMAAAGNFRFESGLGQGPFYGCEAPDAINAVGDNSQTTLRYAGSRSSAAVFTHTPGRAITFGFPLECVSDGDALEDLMAATVDLLLEEE